MGDGHSHKKQRWKTIQNTHLFLDHKKQDPEEVPDPRQKWVLSPVINVVWAPKNVLLIKITDYKD